MPPPAGDNHGWVVFAVRTGFALGHRASTFHACAHLITTAVRYQLRAQGRYFVPEPNMVGGVTGRSPGERPHDGIAGGKSCLAGLSPLSGTPSERGVYLTFPPQQKEIEIISNLGRPMLHGLVCYYVLCMIVCIVLYGCKLFAMMWIASLKPKQQLLAIVKLATHLNLPIEEDVWAYIKTFADKSLFWTGCDNLN